MKAETDRDKEKEAETVDVTVDLILEPGEHLSGNEPSFKGMLVAKWLGQGGYGDGDIGLSSGKG